MKINFLLFLYFVWGLTAIYAQQPETFVPDDNFEAYLETHDANGNIVSVGDATSMGNGIENDDYVFTTAIENINSLDIRALNIADMTGIDHFISLTELLAQQNSFASLDATALTNLEILNVSSSASFNSININGLTNLENLNVSGTKIPSIDLNTNIALITLRAFNITSGLSPVDLSNNTALEFISLQDSQITGNLDLSQHLAIQFLILRGNDFTDLNIKNGTNTNIVLFDVTGNSNLSCVKVDDEAYSIANWTAIDPTTSFNEHCNETYVPDDNFEAYLETHDASGNVVSIGDVTSMGNGIANDDYVFTTVIENINSLDISALNIADMTGIDHFISLTELLAQQNSFASLDATALTNLEILNVSSSASFNSINIDGLTNLENLNVSGTEIPSIDLNTNIALITLNAFNIISGLSPVDLSNNTALEFISLQDSQITGNLDLSQHLAIQVLILRGNDFTGLNIKNGANTNIVLFDVTGNSNLSCVKVDDEAYSIANWTAIDPTTSFNETSCTIIQLAPKIYLQGAMLGSVDGLMRDDLRTNDLIPLDSPYTEDPVTVSPTVLTTNGDDAIVDWVLVQLRDLNDDNVVVASQSALLKRNGQVVSIDGVSDLQFNLDVDQYYVSINHRNHLGVVSDLPMTIGINSNTIDFTTDPTISKGSSLAVVQLSEGAYAIYSGDVTSDGNILNTDISIALSASGGINVYSGADANMDGNILNTDIALIIQPNAGRIQQF